MLTVYTPQHWLHDTRDIFINGQEYIIEEVPQRAEIIKSAVIKTNLGPVVEPEDWGLESLHTVHDPDYIQFLHNIYPDGKKFYGYDRPLLPETFSSRRPQRKSTHPIGLLGYYSFGTYSPIMEGTWSAAYWSAQCALTAAKLAQSNNLVTYAICRPPGHHAGKDYYGGFCYINNAALAARALPGKVAVLDIDFHHGNGTQDIFYDDSSVLYCSIHADPDQEYPYFWGSAEERGTGDSLNTNMNFPLPLGTEDKEYLWTLDRCISHIKDFNPNFLVVSVGFDILQGDPAGGFRITLDGLEKIAGKISKLTSNGLPTVIIQEGGYLLDWLEASASAFLLKFKY